MEVTKPFLVYKSSAGSGKTFNLAKIFLGLILRSDDPHYFKRILAITFTVKAAAEMKDRIITYLSILAGDSTRNRSAAQFMLNALMHETGLSEEDIRSKCRKLLVTILHQYGEFNILTIDKFFARMVRTFASDLSMVPDFDISVDRSEFMDRAADQLFEQIGDNSDLTELTLHMLRSRLADDKGNDADKVIEKACHRLLSDEFYSVRSKFRSWEPREVFTLKEQLDKDAEALLEQIVEPAKKALDLIEQYGLDPSDLYSGTKGIYSYFKKIAAGDIKESSPSKTAIKTVEEDKWASKTAHPAVDVIKEDLAGCFREIQEMSPLISQYHMIVAIRNEVYTLGFYSALESIFEEIRKEDNVRLLSEFNTLISEQLQGEQAYFLFERLGNRFNHILIDEFQDTSVLQWQNLLPLVENSLSGGHTSLVVGDAKQSIYRWRNSEPDQFVNLPAVDHPSQSLIEASYQEIPLVNNYRSAKEVVEFNNRFFSMASEELLTSAHIATYETLAQTPIRDIQGSVRWWVGNEKNESKESLMIKMVDRIRKILNSGKSDQRDICCLFRTNADASLFASMLLQSGYNVISQESLLLKSNPFVRLIIATLRVLQSPRDLFAVQRWLLLYGQVHTIDNIHELAARFKAERADLYACSRKLGVDLKQKLLHQGNSFQKIMAIVDVLGLDPSNAFVAKLLDISLRFEHTGGYLKQSFDTYWESIEENSSIQLDRTMDAISVMTVHKAKGLEFPEVLVFLPEVKKKNTKDLQWVEPNPPFQLGVMPLRLSDLKKTEFTGLYDEENERSWLDELNVLYVAFTRAQRTLEIFSSLPASTHVTNKLFDWPEWDEDQRAIVIDPSS